MKTLKIYAILCMFLLATFGCTKSIQDEELIEYDVLTLIGYWARTYTSTGSEQCVEMWYFASDRTGAFADTDTSNPTQFTFNWKLSGSKLTISNSGGSLEMKIAKLTSGELSLILDGQRFNYTRYTPADPEEPEEPATPAEEEDDISTNYAPSNVRNYEFHFIYASAQVLFTSNSSVNTDYSYIDHYPNDYPITGASYTKTSNNKATVTIWYTQNGQTETRTYYLTFTSTTQGKYHSSQEGSLDVAGFTCKYLGSGEDVSAPSSIAYKKFSTGTYSWSDWYQFGADYGSSIAITSSSESASYEQFYATYSKNNSTSATLRIVKKRSYGSAITYTYNLSFTTSTSGTYSMTSNSSFSTGTITGNFTLQ